SSSLWSLPSIFCVIANDQVMADDLDDLDGPKATRSRRRGRERETTTTTGPTIKQATARTATGPAGRGVHLDKRVPAFSPTRRGRRHASGPRRPPCGGRRC